MLSRLRGRRCRSAPSPISSRAPRRSRSITRASSRRPPLLQSRSRSFPGRRRAGDRKRRSARSACPASIQASFQGTAAAFRNSLANESWLLLAAVVTVYIVLGVLYESYIHPLTILSTLPSAGVGAILALAALSSGFERHRSDRNHSADRHRAEERHHDDRLRPGSRTRGGICRPTKPSIRRACCASGRS